MSNLYYREITASWDEKLLGRRTAPQAVKITTPDFFTKYYPFPMDLEEYFKDIAGFYDRMPSRLSGKLDYKTSPYDYMEAYFMRPGMSGCISEKVKNIFAKLGVSKDEYYIKPIEILGVSQQHYILFFPFKSLFGDADILWSQSVFENFADKSPISICNRKEYLQLKQDNVMITEKRVCFAKKYRKYDILSFGLSAIQGFLSDRIVQVFQEENVVGASFWNPGSYFYKDIVFDD